MSRHKIILDVEVPDGRIHMLVRDLEDAVKVCGCELIPPAEVERVRHLQLAEPPRRESSE